MTDKRYPVGAGTLSSPVLVMGATGLVGRFLVHRVRMAGLGIIAVSRGQQPGCEGVRWVEADLTAPQVRLEVGPVDVAFYLSPLWLLPPALPALRAAGVKRLVAFSSTSRYTKEHSQIEAERMMSERLVEAEVATRTYCEDNGVVWTILRPTLIYAEERDRNVTRLARIIRRVRVLPLAGEGDGMRQPVHADDLAVGALAAAVAPAAANRSFDLPGGETLTYRRMAERIFAGLELRPRIVAVPPPLWRLGLTLAAPFLPGATTAMGTRMGEDLTFDAAPARRAFGWSPREFHPRFGRG